MGSNINPASLKEKEGTVKPRWQLAVYDFDGTLVDNILIAFECMQAIFRTLVPHLTPPTLEEYRDSIGLDWAAFYHDRGIPKTARKEIIRIWAQHFDARKDEVYLHRGAQALLKFCRRNDIPNAIVSASISDIEPTLRRLRVLDFFKNIVIGTEDKSEALIQTLDFFGTKAEDAFYIDDSFDGITAAKKLGMGTIGFTEGHNSRKRILAANPGAPVGSLYDVIEILQNGVNL